MASYTHLSEPDPEFAPHVARLQALTQVFELTARRKQFDSLLDPAKKAYTPGLPKLNTTYRLFDHQVEVADGTEILVRSLVPVSQGDEQDNSYPLMVWIHGGGGQFSTRIGSPLGGNLAAAIAHRARDDPFFKDTKLTGQILQAPALLDPNAVPEKYKGFLLSYEQNKLGPLLAKETMMWAFKQLGGSPDDPEEGLPPAVLQVCGMDALRDELLLYEKLLNNDGVKTKTTVYPCISIPLPHV
ncbi:hypothetical protein C8R44DRAFT_976867 [Mycena epipterygia]|nr:hypothetical protein C8R44DRAFT_976867 [Mycena epipterygia]